MLTTEAMIADIQDEKGICGRKTKMRIETIFKNSPTFIVPGYVLTPDLLDRIDDAATEFASFVDGKAGQPIRSTYVATKLSDGRAEKFSERSSLAKFLDDEPIKTLAMRYKAQHHFQSLAIEFQDDGEISVSCFPLTESDLDIEKVSREIRKCDQEYSWIINAAIFNPSLRRYLTIAIFAMSLFLLANIGYYVYARNYGVDIDSALIPNGNEYFRTVEEAVKSDDLQRKLDALLIAELKGFSNLRDVLNREQHLILFAVISIAILTVVFLIHKRITKLYPRSFFSFGHQITALKRLERGREIWGVVVILGFLINLLAGLVIVFIS